MFLEQTLTQGDGDKWFIWEVSPRHTVPNLTQGTKLTVAQAITNKHGNLALQLLG